MIGFDAVFRRIAARQARFGYSFNTLIWKQLLPQAADLDESISQKWRASCA
jgi:hypothetical protein